MGWWPFSRKPVDLTNDPSIKGTRHWLDDLQSLCERNYDDFKAGQLTIQELRESWSRAHQLQELPDQLFEGLEHRVKVLLNCASQDNWLEVLDDEQFWKPGAARN